MVVTRSQSLLLLAKKNDEFEEEEEEPSEKDDSSGDEEETIEHYWYKYDYAKITLEDIEKNKNQLNWNNLSAEKLSMFVLEKYKKYIVWDNQSKLKGLEFSVIDKFKDYLNWEYICRIQQLSEEIIILVFEYEASNNCVGKYLNWKIITAYQFQNMSEEFINKYIKYLHLDELSKCRRLSESYLKEFGYYLRVDDTHIKYLPPLSSEFFEKYMDYKSPVNKTSLNWKSVFTYQKLNTFVIEKFISNHSLNVNDWELIATYQDLTEDFIWNHIEDFDLKTILRYQRLTKDFRRYLNRF